MLSQLSALTAQCSHSSPGAAALEKKALACLPTAAAESNLTVVSAKLAALSKGPLFNFVSPSGRGHFEAACMQVNNLERDLPIQIATGVTGLQPTEPERSACSVEKLSVHTGYNMR